MQLIEHWRIIIWRRVSTWLAAANAALIAIQVFLVGALAFMPTWLQIPAIIVLFAVLWGVPVFTALVAQPKLQAKIEEAKRAADPPS